MLKTNNKLNRDTSMHICVCTFKKLHIFNVLFFCHLGSGFFSYEMHNKINQTFINKNINNYKLQPIKKIIFKIDKANATNLLQVINS